MSDTETTFEFETEESEQLEEHVYSLPEVESPLIAYEREPDALRVGDKDTDKFETGELRVLDATDPSKEALAYAIGGKPEHWEEVGSGSGQWVFDGEKIFNPSTGEQYSGIDSEKSEAVQEEAVRQWNEGVETHVVIPGHREEAGDRVIIHAFQLILGAPREDGFRDVQWTWHQTELVNLKDKATHEEVEESTPNYYQYAFENGHARAELAEQEHIENAEMMLEHEAFVEHPDTVDMILQDIHTIDVQTPGITAPIEIRLDSPAEQTLPATEESLLAVFLKDEPTTLTFIAETAESVPTVSLTTESPLENVQQGAIAISQEAIEFPTHTMHPVESSPSMNSAEGFVHGDVVEPIIDQTLESLPVFVPNEASSATESVQAMYEAFILSFSRETVATNPHIASESASTQTCENEQDLVFSITANHERNIVSDPRESLESAPIARTAESEPTITVDNNTMPASAEKHLDRILDTIHATEIRVSTMPVEASFRGNPNEVRAPSATRVETSPSSVREAIHIQANKVSPRSIEIASRVLGIQFEPATRESIVLNIGNPRFKPEDPFDENTPRGRATIPTLHGIRMVALLQ
ncbi:MAG: hypothetical protein AAB798_02345 [Patescibacteria group bacterium]